MSIKAVLCDIEGTTTSISFVHEELFPIAARELHAFLKRHWGSELIKDEVAALNGADHDSLNEKLQGWIAADRKDTNLKSLQGKIWREAYENGVVHGHLYEDVLPCWDSWKEQGIAIYIYSSGSIEAQKLLFRHSVAGDLTSKISGYYDTNIGGKKEVASYRAISRDMSIEQGEILFLSDVAAELDAAAAAGMGTMQLLRPGIEREERSKHEAVETFREIDLAR